MTLKKTRIAFLFITVLVACSSLAQQPQPEPRNVWSESQRPLLNSERIRQQFGSYGIEVVKQGDLLRVSNLYSSDNGDRTMRTLAVVLFSETLPLPLQEVHKEIVGGHSIGETFKSAGWEVEKINVYFGELAPDADFDGVYAAMGDIAAVTLAVHIYRLFVSKDESRYLYSTIAEIHHPDYQDLTDLHSNYGADVMMQEMPSRDIAIVLEDVIEVMKQF